MAVRVGPQYPVKLPAVNVFSASPRGDGLCLDTLARGATPSGRPSPDNVARTRAKIGLGLYIFLEMHTLYDIPYTNIILQRAHVLC